MKERKCYADTTDFPKVYKDSYWGSFEWRADCYPEPEIIQNRNKLAKEYKLILEVDSSDIDCRSNAGEIIWYFAASCTLDHGEIYLAENKIYIIQSFDEYRGSLYVRHNDTVKTARRGRFPFMTLKKERQNKNIKFPKADDWKRIYPIYALHQRTYILDITEYLKPFLKKATRKVLQEVV